MSCQSFYVVYLLSVGFLTAFSTSFIQMPFNGTLFFLILKLATFFYTNDFQTQSKSS